MVLLLGATDPAVTQDNIQATICRPGYARSVRPPAVWSRQIKRQMLQGRPGKGVVLDHLVPLELGGAPQDVANLQLQGKVDATAKDREENRIHRAVCAGRMTLEEGRALFQGN